MTQQYTQEQIYDAMRAADAAGDEAAVRALAEALKRGDTQQQINQLARQRGLTLDQEALRANIQARDAGQPTNTFVPPQKNVADYAVEGAVNSLAGVAEGVTGAVFDFPFSIGEGTGNLVDEGIRFVGTNALEALGFDAAAADLDRTITGLHERRAQRMGVADMIGQAIPTPEGQEPTRFAGQVLGALAVPMGPRQAPRITAPKATARSGAQEVVEEGARRGVDVMTTDVVPPRNFISRTLQATGERIPFAGTGGQRVAQNEQRVQAVRDFAQEYGVTGVTDFVDDVASDFLRRRGRQLRVATGRKNQVIDRITEAYTSSPLAVAEIGNQIRRLRGIDAQEYAPIIDRLQRFGEALTSGKSLREIEGQRKLLGDLMADPSLARIKTEGEAAIRAIYDPLRKDMGAFIQRNGGEQAYNQWKASNQRLREMVGDLSDNAFRRALQGADVTPETVSRLIFSQKPSEMRRLFSSLSASGRTKAQSAIIYEALRRSKALEQGGGRIAEEFSPQRFANTLKDMGKQIGVAFDKTDIASIEGFSRLINATQRASVAGAAPPTGVQNYAPVLAAMLTDMMGGFGAASTAAAAYGGLARLYESAPVRNLLISLSRTPAGSRAEGAVLERINNVIQSQGILNREALGRAVNDNNAGRLAAEEQQPEER